MPEVIRLQAPIRLKAKPKEKGFFGNILEAQKRIITSTRTTAVLAGTLSLLTGSGLLTAGKVFLGTGLVGGILEKSPKARSFVTGKILDPTKTGRGIGAIIEDPSKLLPKDKGILTRAREVVGEAELIAGGAALGVGAAAGVAKIAKEVKKKFTTPPALTSQIQTVLPSQMRPQIAAVAEPIGAVQPTPEEVEKVSAPIATPIKIKNVFKPEIDISFRKSRRFINQQILVH